MSKIYLVAQREYVENIRTKTFWIGILAFPVIWILAIVVGRMMDRAKDLRTYAVLDQSEDQWLSKAIAKRAASNDFADLLRNLRGTAQEQEEARKAIQARLDELEPDHPIRDLMQRIAPMAADGSLAALSPDDRPPPAIATEALSWMLSLSPEDRKKVERFGLDLTINKYREVQYGDLGAEPQKTLNHKLQDGELFAYFVIGRDPVANDADSTYVSNNVTDTNLRRWYSGHATEIVRQKRIEAARLTPEQARSIQAEFRFGEQKVSAETGEAESVEKKDRWKNWAPAVFVYLLWIAVFTAAQILLTNTVEEKSNRIIEVLLSSVSPFQLMAGKIFGIAATGLTIIGSWVVCALAGLWVLPYFMADAGNLRLSEIIGDPRYLGSFVAYFLGGYLFYAAILVGVGSVCNSLKEAQNLMQPVVVLLIVPLVAMVPVTNDPNGTLARVLTYIPPFTPFLMMNRAAGPPPAWEYAASAAVIAVSVLLAFWGTAKIFRIGILMTGKPPRVREMLRWLRAPIGAMPGRRQSGT
jgi:ABC-2 type transport system permease protein